MELGKIMTDSGFIENAIKHGLTDEYARMSLETYKMIKKKLENTTLEDYLKIVINAYNIEKETEQFISLD